MSPGSVPPPTMAADNARKEELGNPSDDHALGRQYPVTYDTPSSSGRCIYSNVIICLQSPQIRADYEYLLELILIFLGQIPPKGVKFRPPIALSSARFMGRIIYCLSIYMFARSGKV